ncbi:MAG: 4Fe-4S dicluster domain-containing protein [Clostridia bacterium]|nr:4Fe-4S dicluster domain-containing protein [Clostridia bacterium]
MAVDWTLLVEKLGRGPVTIKPELCLRSRHRQAQCASCASSCPQAALCFPGGETEPDRPGRLHPPEVDPRRCLACGTCASICPTGALELQGYGWSDVYSAIKSFVTQYQRLAVACQGAVKAAGSRVSYPSRRREKIENLPGLPEVLIIPCLTLMTTSFLAYAWRLGAKELEIYGGDCGGCPISGGRDLASILKERYRQLSRLLSYWGESLPARWAAPDELIAPIQSQVGARGLKQEEKPARVGEMSRRDFFRLFSRQAVTTALEAVLPEETTDPVFRDPEVPLPRQVALWGLGALDPNRVNLRQAAGFHGADNAEEGEKALGIDQADVALAAVAASANLEVSPACTGCSICVRVCPTGALRLYAEPGASRAVATEAMVESAEMISQAGINPVAPGSPARDAGLEVRFKPAYCIDCGLCRAVCFTGALSRVGPARLVEFLSGEEKVLFKGFRRQCALCGRDFVGRAEDSYCPSCRSLWPEGQ